MNMWSCCCHLPKLEGVVENDILNYWNCAFQHSQTWWLGIINKNVCSSFLDIHVLRTWTLEAPYVLFYFFFVFDNLFELCWSWSILIWYSLMCILQYWDLMSHLQLVWDMWVYCGNLLVSMKSWDLYGLYTFDYPRLLRHLSRG